MREKTNLGVKWIGKVPESWVITKLKNNISNLKVGPFGSSLKGSDFTDEGYWVYNQRTVLDNNFDSNDTFVSERKYKELSGFIVKPNDILVTTRGSLGRIAIVPETACLGILHPCIIKFRTGDLVNKFFLKYVFNCSSITDAQIEYLNNLTTIGALYSYSLKELYIPLPPIDTQKNIVDFLDEKCSQIDSLSSDIHKQIEILEQYKRSIISEKVTNGLNPKVGLRSSGIDQIGKIPSNWNVKRGKYIFAYVQKPVKEGDEVITCFRDGEVTLRSNRREDGFTMSEKEIGYQGIDVGDLIIHGMDGFAGAIGISDSRGKASPVLNVLETDQSKRYFMYLLRTMANKGVFEALSTGIRVRTCDTNWGKIKNIFYIVPSLDDQYHIVEYLDKKCAEIDSIIADKKHQLEVVENYKKSLIYEYVTGKKEVSDE